MMIGSSSTAGMVGDRSSTDQYYSSSGSRGWGLLSSQKLEIHPLQLPPGFRFHPTDEELVVHYLRKKAASVPLPAVAVIADVDLYKFDPWELPGKASFGEEEWYFFSPRERKYPNGARPNRAATSGYWKATGTDKPILASGAGTLQIKVGVKKALVFYGGKPPKGVKTNWIMHEYRLISPDHSGGGSSSSSKLVNGTPPPPGVDVAAASSRKTKSSSSRLDDWVLCRIYQKKSSASGGNLHQRQEELKLDDGDTDHHQDHMYNKSRPPLWPRDDQLLRRRRHPHVAVPRRPTSSVVLQALQYPHSSSSTTTTGHEYYSDYYTTNICGAPNLEYYCNDIENFLELGLLAAGSVQLQAVNYRPSPHVADDLNGRSMLLPAGSVAAGSALVLPLKRGLSSSATSWNVVEAGAPAIDLHVAPSPAGKRLVLHSCSSSVDDVSGTVNSGELMTYLMTNEEDDININGCSDGGNIEGSRPAASMMATLQLDHLQRQGAPYHHHHHHHSAELSAIGDGVFRQPCDQLHYAPDHGFR